MKKKLISAILLTSGVLAGAQNHLWTLEECIDHALEHNITIKQSAIAVERQEVEVNTAEGKRLPSLSGGARESLSFGRGLTADNTYANTNTTSTSFSLGTDVTVFNGFRIKNNIAMSKLDLESAVNDLSKAKDDISVAVAKAYAQILYDMEIVDVARSQIQIDSLQVVRLTAMAENGKSSRAEVSAQEATLAQSRVSLTQAENNLAIAILDLSQLLELPSPEGFAIARPSVDGAQDKLLLTPEAIYEEAVEIKPVVKSELIRLTQAERNIDLAKGAFMPSISISGGVGSNYYTSTGYQSKGFGTQMVDNFSQSLGLSLNVPIFSGFSNKNQMRTAKLQLNHQKLQLESTKKALFKEIQQAYYNAVGAQDKYHSSQVAANSAADAFELAKARYENGKSGITEFNEAKTRFLSAESELVKARYEYLYQAALLDFYRGKELNF